MRLFFSVCCLLFLSSCTSNNVSKTHSNNDPSGSKVTVYGSVRIGVNR